MKHCKGFSRYYVENDPQILYVQDENKQCWYELRKEFSEHTTKVVYDPKTGKVISFSKDVDCIFPHEYNVIEFENVPVDLDFFHWKVNLETLTLEHSPDEIYRLNRIRQGILLKEATAHLMALSILEDKTPEEEAEYKAWAEFITKVRRNDLTIKKVEWPAKPY